MHRFRAGRNPQSRYDDFNAPPGTYWYHSHTKSHRSMGLQGALVIKPKKPPYSDAIDDPLKQTIAVTEWYMGGDCYIVKNILVNGKGKAANYTFICTEETEKEVLKFNKGFSAKFTKAATEYPKTGSLSPSYEV